MAKNDDVPVKDETPKAGIDFEASKRDVRQKLAAQPKVKVRLRQARAGEQQMPDETVCINGYIMQIKRGVEVNVPQSVAKILYEANL